MLTLDGNTLKSTSLTVDAVEDFFKRQGELQVDAEEHYDFFQRFRVPGNELVFWADQAVETSRNVSKWRNLLDGGAYTEETVAAKQASIVRPHSPKAARVFDGGDDRFPQKVHEDDTGITGWWPTYPGVITADGFAAARFEGIDISPFAGITGSSTPYLLAIKSLTTGKWIWGYLAEADAALALGSELVTNGGFENFTGTADDGNDDDFTSWTEATSGDRIVEAVTTVKAGTYAVKLTTNTASGYQGRITQTITVAAGKLYKLVFWTRGDGTNSSFYDIYDNSNSQSIYNNVDTGVTGTTYTKKEIYFIAPAGCTSIEVQFNSDHSVASASAYFDVVSCKEVTALGTDGCHVVSTKNGATRNFNKQAGFNYNDPAGYEFYIRRVEFNQLAHLTGIIQVKPDDGQPAADEVLFARWGANPNRSYGFELDTTGKMDFKLSVDGSSSRYRRTDDAVFSNGAQPGFTTPGFVYDNGSHVAKMFKNGQAVASTQNGGAFTGTYDSVLPFVVAADDSGLNYAGEVSYMIFASRAFLDTEMERIERVMSISGRN